MDLNPEEDLAKARTLIETLMRRAIAIDKHNRTFLKLLREYSAEIERQTTAMRNVLHREMEENPEP